MLLSEKARLLTLTAPLQGVFPSLCAFGPNAQKAFTKGRRHTLIGWEGNAPSCFHSSVSITILHTGDQNPLQLVRN